MVGEGSQTIGEDMEVDSGVAKKLPVSSNKRKHVGTENLSLRRDHLEIHYPLDEGLGTFFSLLFFIYFLLDCESGKL